tara:strand:+ start:66 stop:578 length:513 start_codon:yes stop_codon:yes gene_type:complete
MKKFFRDNLPKPEDLKKYRALNVLGDSIFEKSLWVINKYTLSRALAIGLFWGWMPMFFQMIPAAFCAVYFRANLPLSLAGVWISNPITMPPMMYIGYEFGNLILGIDPLFDKFEASLEWIGSVFSLIWEPLIVGTFTIGVLSAVVGFFGVHLFWKIIAYRKLKKIKENIK